MNISSPSIKTNQSMYAAINGLRVFPSKAIIITISYLANELFTQQQIEFLPKHYRRYLPYTQQIDQDFSLVKECQVVFLPDIHPWNLMLDSECQFYSLFTEKDQPTCALVEGFSPGTEVNKAEIPQWKNFPKNLTVLGSDNRHPNLSLATITNYQALRYKTEQLKVARKEHYHKIFNQIPALLETAVAFEPVHKVIQVTCQMMKEIEGLYNQLNIEAEIDEVNSQINALLGTKADEETDHAETNVRTSNRGLLDEVRKAAKVYSKVFVRWGFMHYFDDELFAELDASGITYQVLFPPAEKFQQALMACQWQTLKMNKFSLWFATKKFKPGHMCKNFDMPEECATYFSEKVKATFRPKPLGLPPIVTYNRQKLLQLCQNEAQLVFPANTRFQITDIDPVDHLTLLDLQRSKNLDKEQKMFVLAEKLENIINTILIFKGKCIRPLEETPYFYFLSGMYQTPTLEFMTLEEPLTFKIVEGDLIISPNTLFREMVRRNEFALVLKPNQKLFLTMTPAECQQVTNMESFLKLLRSMAPAGYRVDFAGKPVVTGNTRLINRTYEGTEEIVPSIAIWTETNFKIVMKKM